MWYLRLFGFVNLVLRVVWLFYNLYFFYIRDFWYNNCNKWFKKIEEEKLLKM